MHKLFFFSRRVSLLCGAVALSMATAQAQVATSSQALDQLQTTPPPAAPATGKPQSGATQQPARRRPATPSRAPATPSPGTTTGQTGTQGAAPPTTPASPAASAPSTPRTQAPAQQGQGSQGAGNSGQSNVGQGTSSQSRPNTGSQNTAGQKAVPATGTQPQHPAPLPTIPNAPPSEPQLTPAPPDVEIHPFPIPAQPAVELKAPGVVTTVPGGVRLTFAPGSAALNPETHQALLAFGQRLSDKPHIRAMIDAYSSGAADDPSLPRRMALARGLAARSVLMNGGTPSTRIYLRVIGEPPQPKPGETQDYITIYESDAAP